MTPGRTPEARPPVLAPRTPSPRPLVDIVTGSFGAGHDAAAREIAARFQARGYDTRSWDIVDLFPAGLGRVVRAGYLRQLVVAPPAGACCWAV